MLEVNIWFSTPYRFGKRIKHGVFGPFFASEEKGENVGHANFVLSVDERSKIYERLAANPCGLQVTHSLEIIPEIRDGETRRYYAPKTVKSLQIDHSFWPVSVPPNSSILKDILHLMHLGKGSKGVAPVLGTHAFDMQREDRGTKTSKIERRDSQYAIDKAALVKEQQENIALAFEISNLRTQLDNKLAWEGTLKEVIVKKSALKTEQEKLFKTYPLDVAELKKQITQTSNKLNENKKKIGFLDKKLSYSTSLSTPDSETIKESSSGKEQLLNLEKEQQQLKLLLNELKKKLVQVQREYADKKNAVQKELNHVHDTITCLQKWIQGSVEKVKNRDEQTLKLLEEHYQQQEEMTKRKETVFNRTYETIGLHPDHSINLPTSESGLNFYINEEAVTAAMQKETGRNYSLVRNNCVSSAKRCLLAGIEHLKDDLQENGVPESFFKMKAVETCKGFRTWVKQLEKELIKLNSSVEISHCPPQPMV
ncbi:hypothetical protein [Legionella maioricensis]|uniref:Uncharacterized protein n=1 Tax=Legionella maioricensis TaxID=2896528 RepID=A0A9X2IBD8_9GAMM|nr:hypothetical protein [Legionella maioricensis]MCL9684844.1 hypothetical protein [Legionella maioricensis]MCL9688524.1 hypothetical protein [Legionella maioricensis]